MKKNISSIIFGIAIVLSSFFLGKAYVDRTKVEGEIQVTGLGENRLFFRLDCLGRQLWRPKYRH